MKKRKHFLKKILSIICAVILLIGSFASCYFYIITKNEKLDLSNIENIKTANSIYFYDKNGVELPNCGKNYIKLSKLSKKTINAFLCAEDKRFYYHSGVDVIRIFGAIKNNIKTKSFSQGGSTISQQLIKNVQLTNEKTFNRKLKEVKLTFDLEKKYSKNEILEMYLNSIYFGSGCYGIEDASLYYFNKPASKLTLEESALLAGTINAPSYYDIKNNFKKANKRKDLILDIMKKNHYISQDEFLRAKNSPINLNLNNFKENKFNEENIIGEASSILKLNETQLNNSKYKIITSVNESLQSSISKIIDSYYDKIGNDQSISTIVLDNKTKGIVSITGKTNVFKTKIQPGSTIKPILVFAPAIEYNNISPATKILDEKIDYNGYCPSNADKKYHGYVSVRESLKNSYNIPAVKILNEIGIDKAQKFASKFGITFTEKDKNLATALGAMTEGITLKSLADAYMTFANSGNFEPSTYITKILNENKTVYEKVNKSKRIMSDATAYLITDILLETSKSGTAKRMSDVPFQIASKTGTVGKQNSQNNIAAINVCYTTDNTILVYIGGNNLSPNINGSSYPTMIAKEIIKELYKKNSPPNFTKPESVKNINISKTNYEKNILAKTDDINDGHIEKFKLDNLPNYYNTLSKKIYVINNPKEKPQICFYTNCDYKYKIIRSSNNKKEIIFSEQSKQNQYFSYNDKNANNSQIYEYYIEIYDKTDNFITESNHVKIKTY